ncbi:hypothetical protein H4R20_000543 [Coemansia guatemalensis]|uniref:Uncharacterized protein n=1 Tax=Coemansia guatemalensis TaxID=2761395 RepID=A0A9W8LVR3_9FUNG|nr:hypothetical protein H4R20_000543 [Coemansia guatemalensis]
MITTLPSLERLHIADFILTDSEMGDFGQTVWTMTNQLVVPFITGLKKLHVRSKLPGHSSNMLVTKLIFLVMQTESLEVLLLSSNLISHAEQAIAYFAPRAPHLGKISVMDELEDSSVALRLES